MLPKIFFSEFLLLFAFYSFSLRIRCLMERLVEQKSKEKAFKFLKFVPLGKKKRNLGPEGTQVIKVSWGEIVLSAVRICFSQSCHTPCFPSSPPVVY